MQVQQQEDKLIYDMDSKSTQNQPAVQGSKRKRQISSEETEDAVNSILPKKRRESSGGTGSALDDSGFGDEDEKVRTDDDTFLPLIDPEGKPQKCLWTTFHSVLYA